MKYIVKRFALDTMSGWLQEKTCIHQFCLKANSVSMYDLEQRLNSSITTWKVVGGKPNIREVTNKYVAAWV